MGPTGRWLAVLCAVAALAWALWPGGAEREADTAPGSVAAEATPAPEAAPPVLEGRPAEDLGPPGRETLDVEVEFACAGAPPADVWVVDAVTTSRVVAQARTDEHGRARVPALRPGAYRVVAAAERCGRAAVLTDVPRADAVRLTLRSERTVEVLVVEEGSNAPIPNARVSVLESYREGVGWVDAVSASLPREVTTDEAGRVVLRGVGLHDSLVLTAWDDLHPVPPNRGLGDGPWRVRLPTGATEATLVCRRARVVTWPVKTGAVPPPPVGTALRLTLPHGPRDAKLPEARMEPEGVVVVGWEGRLDALAVAPDGAIAPLLVDASQERGRETQFVASRSIRVTLVEEGAGPLGGWLLRANSMSQSAEATTDQGGAARIDGVYVPFPAASANVTVSARDPAGTETYLLGTVELSEVEGRLDAVLPRMRDVVVRIVPAAEAADALVAIEGQALFDRTVDPAAGEVRGRWRARPNLRRAVLVVRAPGYLPVSRSLEVGGVAALRADVALVSVGTLAIRVLHPEPASPVVGPALSSPQPVFTVLERLEGSTWRTIDLSGGQAAAAGRTFAREPTGLQVVTGRYRARDALTGAVSQPVDVAGGEVAEAVLDLRRSGWVRGTIVGPSGKPVPGARAVVEGTEPYPGFPRRGRAGADGAFEVRVPGDRPVRIRGVHATFVPDPQEGFADVVEPRDDVVLRMVPGARATLRFDRSVDATRVTSHGGQRNFRLLAASGGAASETDGTYLLSADGRTVTLGGYSPGTYTLWVDASPFLPVVRSGVVLGAEDADLGMVELVEGSRFVLTLDAPAGRAPPPFVVQATCLDPTWPDRSATSTGGREVTVTGLGPARFRISACAEGYAAGEWPLLDEEIVFDGRSDVRRTLDLR